MGFLVYKRIEAELAAANRQIEALKEQVKVSADAAQNSILANMGHELRTPFNAIIGFTEMILDRQFGELTPLQEEYLGDVAQSAHNLLALINDILDIAAVEAKEVELEPSLVKLDDLLARCLVLVKEKAAKHGIKLTTEIKPDSEAIEADESKLKRIVFNLLTGALNFTPDGGEVRLKAEMTQQDVCISVENSGLGIKEENLQRVFGSFEKTDDHSIHSCQRTQPGLSITQKLVELHGGSIWVESEDGGKGAALRFLIPRKQNANNS